MTGPRNDWSQWLRKWSNQEAFTCFDPERRAPSDGRPPRVPLTSYLASVSVDIHCVTFVWFACCFCVSSTPLPSCFYPTPFSKLLLLSDFVVNETFGETNTLKTSHFVHFFGIKM